MSIGGTDSVRAYDNFTSKPGNVELMREFFPNTHEWEKYFFPFEENEVKYRNTNTDVNEEKREYIYGKQYSDHEKLSQLTTYKYSSDTPSTRDCYSPKQ